jgi:hypothetical protein
MFIPENNIRLEIELLLIALGIDVRDALVQRDIHFTLSKIIRVVEIHKGMTDRLSPVSNNSIFGFLEGE